MTFRVGVASWARGRARASTRRQCVGHELAPGSPVPVTGEARQDLIRRVECAELDPAQIEELATRSVRSRARRHRSTVARSTQSLAGASRVGPKLAERI